MSNDRLFSDFAPVSTEEWEAQIRRDLGDRDYDSTLLWRAPFGPTLRPYYRADDLAALDHLQAGRPIAKIPSGWIIRQDVSRPSLDAARTEIRDAVEGGAEGIGLLLSANDTGIQGIPARSQQDLAALLDVIPLPDCRLHLDAGTAGPAAFAMLRNEIERRSLPADSLGGALTFDPLSDLARSGYMVRGAFTLARRLFDTDLAGFRLLQAGTHVFHAAGADLIQDTALAAASVSEYAARLTEEGVPARAVFDRLAVSVSVSSSYFAEIARLRALRLILPQVVRGFLPEADAPQLSIHAVTSERNRTRYDPHSNLLRTTTEAASAVIGGCDVLCVRPFDSLNAHSTPLARRLARNIQHILRHEAYLDKVADPAAGSYYVEVLTDRIAREAWDGFKEIEARGGLVEALKDGFVASMLRSSRVRLEEAVADRRRILVGTNRYPDPSERRLEEVAGRTDEPGSHDHEGRAEVEADALELSALRRMFDGGAALDEIVWEMEAAADRLRPFREAEAVEALRLATEQFAQERGRIPAVLILPVGEAAARSARAHFAASFMGCGGFDVHVPVGFDQAHKAVDAVRSTMPEVVVVAAPDAWYTPEVIREVRGVTGVVLVGIVSKAQPTDEADFALHRGSNLVETLTAIQERLGMYADVEGKS